MNCGTLIPEAAGLESRMTNVEQGMTKVEGNTTGTHYFILGNSLLDIEYSSRGSAKRSGVVLIAVLVALLIVMLISATIVRGLVVQHRLASAEPIRVQAFWLAESALQRARTQLESNVEYDGETWQAELVSGGGEFGQVVIRVEHIENELGNRTIIVQARFPKDPINGVLEERTLVVETARPADES